MMEMVGNVDGAARLKKHALGMACGGFLGFFGALALAGAAKEGHLGIAGGSEIAALGVAMIYLLMALAVGAGVLSPRLGARFLNVEDAGEIEEQRRVLGYSVAAMILLGLALAVAALSGPEGVIPGRAGLAVVLAAILGAVVLSWRQWRHVDELTHAVSREAMTAGYYLVAAVGGGWALLAHVEEVRPPAPLDWLTMIWGFVLAGVFAAAGKRGMLRLK